MSREKSIQALLSRAEDVVPQIEKHYKKSLELKEVSEELKIDIKNLCENLRSVLDYLAHEIIDSYCPNANPNDRLYFPITRDKDSFENKMKKSYPDLEKNNKMLYNYLESIQPYQSADAAWLGKFVEIANENKHQNLLPQERKETRTVKVSRGQGSVSWGPGVNFGKGVSVMEVPIDPNTQMPIPNDLVTTEVTLWVDFRFSEVNESVLPLLKKALNGISEINRNVGNKFA